MKNIFFKIVAFNLCLCFCISSVTAQIKVVENGDVGVGIENPTAKVQIVEDTNSDKPILELTRPAYGENNIRFSATEPGKSYSQISLDGAHNQEFKVELDVLGIYGFENFQINKNGGTKMYHIDAQDQHFWYKNGVERMRLDRYGRLGIGTSTPEAELHINDNGIRAELVMTGSYSGITDVNAIKFQYGQRLGNINGRSIAAISVYNTKNANDSGGEIRFRTKPTGELSTSKAPLSRMIIKENGDIGIGATSVPREKLDVDGNIALPSNSYLSILSQNGEVANGGYIQGTSKAGFGDDRNPAGYGIWTNCNAKWVNAGDHWVQPRGSQASYLYTSNIHLGWTWRYAAAGGADHGIITPITVANMDRNGTLTVQGYVDTLYLIVALVICFYGLVVFYKENYGNRK